MSRCTWAAGAVDLVMEHRKGPADQKPLVLVGKGLTFDSGGISIKPSQGMEEMKFDMCGAAAVLGAMQAIGELGIEANVVALVPSSENLLSGAAVKPGDVIQSHLGKSIEIINTDAEGRLILADALSYARRFEPAAVVDAATLTGACVIALGHFASAALGNDDALIEELRAAGDRVGQRVWPLPMFDDYRELIKSDYADIKNSGGRAAGTITAAWFLREFVGDFPWVHFDIAGTAYPGFTVFRAGWIGAPQVGAMLGDLQRLRIFYDGIELDPIDPRNGGMHDLTFVQLWHLEEVRIERGASEIRVHLRSWRVRSMTPATRVDIGTGDLETNGYRGYFGRRFGNGAALQLGANQVGTRDNRGAGDADGLSLFGRIGWAKGPFSADASFTRSARDRTEQLREEPLDNLPAFDGASTESYVRVAYRDTTLGIWTQLTAAQLSHSQNNLAFTDTVSIPFRPEPSELTPSRRQYIAAGGWGRGPLELSLTARMRRFDDLNYVAPSARIAFDTPRLTVAGFAEQQPELNLRRLEVSGRVLPLSWLGLSGAVSQFAPTQVGRFATSLTYRGEVGVRLNRAWLSAGLLSRDTAQLVAPIIFDTSFTAGASGPVSGLFVSLRGKIWKDVGFDATAIKWDSAGSFLPAYQTRTQLYVNTGWLSRFPSGNFNVLFAITHEYRTRAFFPVGETVLESSQYRTLNAQLEIRLLQATLTYQFRNVLNEQYQQVPGFFMHRPVQYYGVRWYFFN
jgi:hypothetical protein